MDHVKAALRGIGRSLRKAWDWTTGDLRGAGALVLGVVMATGTHGTAAAEEVTDRGAWLLDEPGTPATAVDSSGLGNHGTNYDIVGTGSGYQFNGTSSRVIVADSPSLDPGLEDFSFGVTILMDAPPEAGETYDVLRKGLASAPGGFYKVEIKRVKGTARARCVIKDTNKVLGHIIAPTSLANGRPHSIKCTKTATGVTIAIDSLAPRTKAIAALGSVSNTHQLALGAKAETTTTTGFDWYQGQIDEAWLRIG